CEPRPSLSYPAGSKSVTSAPICTGNADVSNDFTGPIPLTPRVRFFQKTSRPEPIGVTRPRPVMTTRRIVYGAGWRRPLACALAGETACPTSGSRAQSVDMAAHDRNRVVDV